MPEFGPGTLLGGFEFRDPIFLLALLLAPLAYRWAAGFRGTVRWPSTALLRQGPRSWRVRCSWIPPAGLALATACLAVALAGPRSGDDSARVRTEGIAIMLAIDRSGSMDARDFVRDDQSINRLDVVKQVLERFVLGDGDVAGRPDDLIGAVAFGTYADSVSPLTLDHANLMSIVNALEVATTQDESATAIGEGLGLAVERLRDHPARSKVIVLLTDGVNNAGNLDPAQAAELAARLGIKVYTVGAGYTGIAPLPMRMPGGRVVMRPTRMDLDERTLAAIAKRTDGQYFHARDAGGLAEAYAEIDRLERTEVSQVRYLQYREHYVWFALAALLLALAAELAGATTLRRLP